MSAVLRTPRRPVVDLQGRRANAREEAGGQPAIAQLELVPSGRLPLNPWSLAGMDDPLDRGRFYNDLDLCSLQRACAEEARRQVIAGAYPEARIGECSAHPKGQLEAES